MSFTLRDYQQEAIDSCLSWLENNEGNPLLVLPTGAGKSVIISGIIDRLAVYKPRVLVVTHVKELIIQNRLKLPKHIDAGIYSAGAGSRQFQNMVTFCGIQSVYKKANLFGCVDLIMIDEAHLLSPSNDAMYQKFIGDLKNINPALRIIGLTATPFRTSGVLIGEGNLFTEICYNVPLKRLIKDGYLAPLKSRSSLTQADMQGVKIVAGEFNLAQMSERHMAITDAAVQEICELGADRKSWLLFASSVQHCDMIAQCLIRRGITCAIVTGDSPDRDDILKRHKEGKIRAVINYGVLTTGYDSPGIDLLAILRSTQSTGLYVQILGRGMRIAPGKENCLVLDYGGNIERHGPVDAIRVVEKRTSSGKTEYEISVQPTIICPGCRTDCHARSRTCPQCGHEFPVEARHEVKASDAAVLSQDVPITKMEVVHRMCAVNKGKNGKKDTLRVSYYSSTGGKVTEWLCFDHPAGTMPHRKAQKWWTAHSIHGAEWLPESVQNAFENEHMLKELKAITYRKEDGFDRIYSYEFRDENEIDPVPTGVGEGDIEDASYEIVW